MAWNKTDRAFKTLINKRTTDSNGKFFYNEKGDFTINVHVSEIWLTLPPTTPPTLTNLQDTGIVKYYDKLTLYEDTSVPNKHCWFASTDGTESGRLKDWISDKYDDPTIAPVNGYGIRLFDSSNTQISTSDASGWFFDTQTGILTFTIDSMDTGTLSSRQPFKITGYRYTGAKGTNLGTLSSVAVTNGITTQSPLNGNPITTTGTLALDLAYSPSWTGLHAFSQNPILPLTAPTTDQQAAHKKYVDDSVATRLPLSGGTLTGNLNFSLSSPSTMYGLALASINLSSWSGTAITGSLVWDTNATTVKVYNGSAWEEVAGGVSGTGTINKIPKWTSSAGLGDSIISEDTTFNGGDGKTRIIVDGHIMGVTKNFIIDHPTKPDKHLIYGCLEGPENAVYHRGRISGKGEMCIILPEYWSELVDNYDIYLTAYGNYSIFVSKQEKDRFYVKRCGFSLNRIKKIDFTFYVVGNRTKAPLIIEQNKTGANQINNG